MQTERQREAQEFRSQGTQRGQEIRAKADRDVIVILAEAQSKGEQTRGEGDAVPEGAGRYEGKGPPRRGDRRARRRGARRAARNGTGVKTAAMNPR